MEARTISIIEGRLHYYTQQANKAHKEYTRTGKLVDRLVAIRYNAKVELLEELLK